MRTFQKDEILLTRVVSVLGSAHGDPYCHRCDNKGTIIVCVDDMCRGAGECMHGDGEIVCPDCKGESGDL